MTASKWPYTQRQALGVSFERSHDKRTFSNPYFLSKRCCNGALDARALSEDASSEPRGRLRRRSVESTRSNFHSAPASSSCVSSRAYIPGNITKSSSPTSSSAEIACPVPLGADEPSSRSGRIYDEGEERVYRDGPGVLEYARIWEAYAAFAVLERLFSKTMGCIETGIEEAAAKTGSMKPTSNSNVRPRSSAMCDLKRTTPILSLSRTLLPSFHHPSLNPFHPTCLHKRPWHPSRGRIGR